MGDYQTVVVHSVNDLFVIAGHGTVMAELVDQVAGPDIVLAPVLLLRQEPQLVGKRVGAVLTGGHVEWMWPWPCLDGTETMRRRGD